ncbi:MAG: DUF2442 domain-containing protein [Phycisphaerales bacterium]|nr:DUF2442 domain-containing protein [Phycisphaerae bacterium]NNF42018.1 DUF2442 domain-containing protein [Phycisphaerales bacterium]NNM25125.1 DUF2442 domain-containing protein [Phycisphaerales bacterium]
MITSGENPGERVKTVSFPEGQDALSVEMLDGRTVIVPLAWFPKLRAATPAQRSNWALCGGGFGIHWPDLDEDLNTEGLLRGAPAPGSTSTRDTQ